MPAILTVDLGVQTCRAAIRTATGLELIPFGGGAEFPNVVGMASKGQMIVGVDAERQSATRAAETATHYLRWLGMSYSKPSFEKLSALYPYALTHTPAGVEVVLEQKPHSPAALAAKVIAALRDAAQDFCGDEVLQIYLSVPSAWSPRQIRELKASVDSLGLVSEKILPHLVALALSRPFSAAGRRWVIDIGPQSIEWGMIEREGDNIYWRDSGGDQFFGIEALCSDLLERHLTSFEAHHGVAIGRTSQAFLRLQQAFEKKIVHDGPLELHLPFIAEKNGEPVDFSGQWSASVIAAASASWINSVSGPLLQFFREYKPGDDLLLSGSILARVELREALTALLPSDAQVLTADAACAGLITDLTYRPCFLEAVGVEDHRGTFHRIFPRHAQPPCEIEREFEVTHDATGRLPAFAVYQGERRKAQENRWLGNFEFLPLPGKMKTVERVKVRFSLTETGQLDIAARQAGQQIATQKVISL